jgi:hypothetical protein
MTYHYGQSWCSNRNCPCAVPWKPCSRWMGWRGTYNRKDKDSWPARWCPRCGWEKSDHKPLIHKGGKP